MRTSFVFCQNSYCDFDYYTLLKMFEKLWHYLVHYSCSKSVVMPEVFFTKSKKRPQLTLIE